MATRSSRVLALLTSPSTTSARPLVRSGVVARPPPRGGMLLRSPLHHLLGLPTFFSRQCDPLPLAASLSVFPKIAPPPPSSFKNGAYQPFSDCCYNLCSARIGGGFTASRMSSTSNGADSGGSSVPSVVAHKPKICFCLSCGGQTKQVIPDGEDKMRAVCTLCGRIHYENPKMVVGCLVEHNNKVLLCKRKIEPSYGYWTLPAGFMEVGESAVEGAVRETLEEACAEVEILSPFAQLDIPYIGHIYLIFRAKLKKPTFAPGPESLECALFGPDDIPFDCLAFSSIMVTLRMYIEDIKAGKLKFHYCTIHKRPGTSLTDPCGFDVNCVMHS